MTKKRKWKQARQAWQEFAARNPVFGISGTPSSFSNFCRMHAETLIAADVMRRTKFGGGLLIADDDRFDQAVFDLLTAGPASSKAA